MSLREQLNATKIQTMSSSNSSLEASVFLNAAISKTTQKMEQYDELMRTFFRVISSRQVNPDRVVRILEQMVLIRTELQKSVSKLLKSNKKSVPVNLCHCWDDFFP